MFVNPAAKHNASSGKKGNKNAIVKKSLSFPLNFLSVLSSASRPKKNAAAFTPAFLPIINAASDPVNIPAKQISPPKNTPKILTPAVKVTIPGIGKITTCNKVKPYKANAANAPFARTKVITSSTESNFSLTPIFSKKNNIKTITAVKIPAVKNILTSFSLSNTTASVAPHKYAAHTAKTILTEAEK